MTMAPGSEVSRYLAAYRKWMGVAPYPAASGSTRCKGRSPSERSAINADASVELVVSVGKTERRSLPPARRR